MDDASLAAKAESGLPRAADLLARGALRFDGAG